MILLKSRTLARSKTHFKSSEEGVALVTVAINNTINMTLTIASGNVTIYWGDGDSDVYSGASTPTHTYSDGEPSHEIRLIGALDQVTHLYAIACNLSAISGTWSMLTSLVALRLNNNQISDISPLSGMTSLTTLHLYSNQISDISPLSGLTSLTTLYINGNQISDISPLSGLTSLVTLRLDNNQISDISPLSGLTSLVTLYLNINQISDISPLSGLTSLVALYLNINQISDLGAGLGAHLALTTLYLQDNSLSQALVDQALEDIADTIGSRPVSATFYIHGTNSAPSADPGCVDYATIVAHGWTVLVTGDCA